MSDSHRRVGARLGRLAGVLGAIVAACVDLGAANLATPFEHGTDRAAHAFFELGSWLLLGLASDALWLAVDRARGFFRGVSAAVLVALHASLALWLVGPMALDAAHRVFDGRWVRPLQIAFVLGASVSTVACALLGRWLARREIAGVLGGLFAASALIGHQLVLRDDWMDSHALLAICAATMLGAILAERHRDVRVGLVPCALAASIALGSVLVEPPHRIRVALLRSPGAAGAWVYARARWTLPELASRADARIATRWLEDRRGAPPRAPSGARPFTAPAVVVLLTVDALRADVVSDPRARVPNLARLLREGVTFTRARTCGSQTATSLAALFSGKHASELFWQPYGTGRFRYLYPAEDATPRLAQRLRAGGVTTTKVASLAFLANRYGVASGFEQERLLAPGGAHARGATVLGPLLDWLAHVPPGRPAFLYAHFTEPHEPYDRGARSGTEWERYLGEVEVVDGLLGRLIAALSEPGLRDRSLLLVTSDHGEAFGEHGTIFHSKTLYEELVRVPLLAWGVGVAPRAVDVPVSLVDLAPTVLDAFGQATPDELAGQSLLPWLVGRDVPLTRPIVAEGRQRRALVIDSDKVIVDARAHTIEAFDLARDPLELHDLYDDDPERFTPMLAALHAYFDAHAFRAPGYVNPYRP